MDVVDKKRQNGKKDTKTRLNEKNRKRKTIVESVAEKVAESYKKNTQMPKNHRRKRQKNKKKQQQKRDSDDKLNKEKVRFGNQENSRKG